MPSPGCSRRSLPRSKTAVRGGGPPIRRAIDFDLLRQELADHIVEGPAERYRLDWPGKRESAFDANRLEWITLLPVRDESVDFDTTQNLFIEGDNLKALKLLQDSYLGKVKLIYIDPPYNTGNDFIYDDDFAESTADYLERSGQVDEDRGRLIANLESNGRFHSDWLSMMYPRLKLARNLLSDDGVIFISIDSGEAAGLRLLCDQVFGSHNFIDELIWQKKVSPSNDSQYLSNDHEQVLIYARDKRPGVIRRLERTDQHNKYYTNPDGDARGRWNSVASHSNKSAEDRPNLYYPITNPNTGLEVLPPRRASWKYSKETMAQLIEDGRLYWGASGQAAQPRIKKFLSEAGKVVPRNVLGYAEYGSTQSAATELRELLGGDWFDYPKPTSLVRGLLALAVPADESSIVVDFFAGSSTTAHAVMAANAADGGNRRFIMVQLDEATPENSAAREAGFDNIAQLSRERIRRAGKKIKDEAGLTAESLDVGFRTLRVDSTSYRDVLLTPDDTSQVALDVLVDNIKDDRTPEDLLFEVMLDWGLELSLPIERAQVEGADVFLVEGTFLIACFDHEVSDAVIRSIAERKPTYAVFRDSTFASDDAQINAKQIFTEVSPDTQLKVI